MWVLHLKVGEGVGILCSLSYILPFNISAAAVFLNPLGRSVFLLTIGCFLHILLRSYHVLSLVTAHGVAMLFLLHSIGRSFHNGMNTNGSPNRPRPISQPILPFHILSLSFHRLTPHFIVFLRRSLPFSPELDYHVPRQLVLSFSQPNNHQQGYSATRLNLLSTRPSSSPPIPCSLRRHIEGDLSLTAPHCKRKRAFLFVD